MLKRIQELMVYCDDLNTDTGCLNCNECAIPKAVLNAMHNSELNRFTDKEESWPEDGSEFNYYIPFPPFIRQAKREGTELVLSNGKIPLSNIHERSFRGWASNERAING